MEQIKKTLRDKPSARVIVVVVSLLLVSLMLVIINNSSQSTINNQTDNDSQVQIAQNNQEENQPPTTTSQTNQGSDSGQPDPPEQTQPPSSPPVTPPPQQVDDWAYDPSVAEEDVGIFKSPSHSLAMPDRALASPSPSIGFSVGGAKGIDNFRKNIENGYLPSPADITHEGIFYDYFFDTGQTGQCNQLFCPSYSAALASDPFSNKQEHFLAVGLNSNIKTTDFKRKKLNLVVVLDISGSMSSRLDSYYYDQRLNPNHPPSPPTDQPNPATKMEVANKSLVALLKHLKAGDRLGVVLFDDEAYVAKELRLVEETDMQAIADHILEIYPRGGTNMEAGYQAGSKLLEKYKNSTNQDYENRIIFLTDAMPNVGSTGQADLAKLTGDNAKNGIYTSFIGIGLDFNAELVEALTKIRGANYYSVHSEEEFKRRLDEGFEYMVTPLVFDLSLDLNAKGYDIKAVYGSPEADLATGQIMKINTLFPSLRTNNQTRGGLVLLHLNKTNDSNPKLSLTVSYRDRSGKKHQNQQSVNFPTSNTDYFPNTGIHKGVVLARQVNVLTAWLNHQSSSSAPIIDYPRLGIPHPDLIGPIDLGYWERVSRELSLASEYRPIITKLKQYIDQESSKIKDDTLSQETKMLDLILASGDKG